MSQIRCASKGNSGIALDKVASEIRSAVPRLAEIAPVVTQHPPTLDERDKKTVGPAFFMRSSDLARIAESLNDTLHRLGDDRVVTEWFVWCAGSSVFATAEIAVLVCFR